MQTDPGSDFDDAAEFFRRGDDGDYAEAESLPVGTIAFAENDEQYDQTDPKVLERRAVYTRWVTLGMSALSLVTVLAIFTHAQRGSPDTSLNAGSGYARTLAEAPPATAAVGTIASSRPSTVASAAAPSAAKASVAAAPRRALPSPKVGKPISGYSLAVSKVAHEAPASQRANDPPTARFPD